MNIYTILAAITISSASTWYLTDSYVSAGYETMIADQKSKDSQKLAEALIKLRSLEDSYNNIATELEVQSEKSRHDLESVAADNRRLAAKLGGLRDPGARKCGPNPVRATAEPAINTADSTSGAELSAEASEFLLVFARDSDEAARYASTCYQWIQQLKSAGR